MADFLKTLEICGSTSMDKHLTTPADCRESDKEWQAKTLQPFLVRTPERLPQFTSLSGATVQRLYTPADVQDLDFQQEIGYPGQPPFTRGIHPTMYRGKVWTMRQFSGFGTPEDTNARFHYLLAQGQSGLSAAFHLPTLMGLDS